MEKNEDTGDHHHSKPTNKTPEGATRQHHRLARGETVDGQKKPYGAEADTRNLMGNNEGKRW